MIRLLAILIFLPSLAHADWSLADLNRTIEQTNFIVNRLDDGTMIVIESGRSHIGETVILTVTSVLQTSAGWMIFGRFEQLSCAPGAGTGGSPPA